MSWEASAQYLPRKARAEFNITLNQGRLWLSNRASLLNSFK